jgi:hypothetical protein
VKWVGRCPSGSSTLRKFFRVIFGLRRRWITCTRNAPRRQQGIQLGQCRRIDTDRIGCLVFLEVPRPMTGVSFPRDYFHYVGLDPSFKLLTVVGRSPPEEMS